MAAISSARSGPTALTPPSSSHSDEIPWGHPQQHSTLQEHNGSAHYDPSHRHSSVYQYSGNSSSTLVKSSLDSSARKMHSLDNLYGSRWDKAVDSGLSSSLSNESKMGRSDGSSYNQHSSSEDLKEPGRQRGDLSFGEDKWIHRDKLAKIENEELQKAGFYVPRPRAQSKQRRERSARREAGPSEDAQSRPKNDTVPGALEGSSDFWDLRTPEEIAGEESRAYFVPNGSKAGSRIPVAKISPAPIPQDFFERESPASRKATDSPEDEPASTTIPYPKSRSRSGSANVRDPVVAAISDTTTRDATLATSGRPAPRSRADSSSPKKSAAGARAPRASKASTATDRPKTRSGPNRESHGGGGGSTTRPLPRSGDSPLINKAPEGEPPWMFVGYKPDPRLPPEQQIIPTVARRLAQEKWEREGKFGDVYDKDFRPLNDTFLVKMSGQRAVPARNSDEGEQEQGRDPGQEQGSDQIPDQAQTQPQDDSRDSTPTQIQPESETELQIETLPGEWPLKTELSKASTMRQGSSYSTMPKVSDKPPTSSGSKPRTPVSTQASSARESKARSQEKTRIQRVPSLSDEEEKKAGCGCCVVM